MVLQTSLEMTVLRADLGGIECGLGHGQIFDKLIDTLNIILLFADRDKESSIMQCRYLYDNQSSF